MPLLHAGLFFQYLTYLKYLSTTPTFEKKKRKITKLNILLSRLSILTWKIGYLFKKKNKYNFVYFWKFPMSASLARRVSFPRYSPGLSEDVCPCSCSLVGSAPLCMSWAKTTKGKRVKRSRTAGRFFSTNNFTIPI